MYIIFFLYVNVSNEILLNTGDSDNSKSYFLGNWNQQWIKWISVFIRTVSVELRCHGAFFFSYAKASLEEIFCSKYRGFLRNVTYYNHKIHSLCSTSFSFQSLNGFTLTGTPFLFKLDEMRTNSQFWSIIHLSRHFLNALRRKFYF